jgi:hypothetical protein
MRHSLIIIMLGALLIGGCTSSSGGGDTTSTPSTGEIGRRSVPGYDVIVSREANAAAGVYRVDLVGAAPAKVEAWVACCGYDPDAATIDAEAIAGTSGSWRVTLPTSGKLWVRITDAGGNLLEVGGDDFPVGP